ncbi:MAG: RdgB/HAM1 family non-canonical purine NTP pyrophosphatase [Woeseia sp.]
MPARAQKIVLASGNPGKIREIRRLLAPLGLSVVPQADFAVSGAAETGDTFTHNALLKARHAARLTGLPAIADDSGLCVDALDGAPGVHSARYAGDNASDDDNIDRLLDALQGVSGAARGAAFHCVAVFVRTADDTAPLIAEGTWRGEILDERRGDRGFGYDPVFFDPQAGKSAAMMSAAGKNARSHRGQAFALLTERLAQSWPR